MSRSGLPPGIAPLGAGLAINGVLTYGFLALASRNLTDGAYGALAVAWGLIALLGAGVFQPLEQELSRATSDRAARGFGSKPVLISSLRIGVVSVGLLCAALVVWWFFGFNELIGNDNGILIALLLALVAFMLTEVYRGLAAGQSRFTAYGGSLITEGTIRVLGVAALMSAGIVTAGAYASLIAASFFAAALAAALGSRPLARPGPAAEPQELRQNLSLLLVMALAESFLLNVGPVAVSIFADLDGEPGRFLNGLVIARLPLLLFQAIKISILPSRTKMVAEGQSEQLADATRRLAFAVGAFGLVTVAGSALLGPFAVNVLFADSVSSVDMALLSGANALSMLAILYSLTLVAGGHPRWAASSWVVGVVSFTVALALPLDAFRRVEIALIAGFCVAMICMATANRRSIRILSESHRHRDQLGVQL